MYAPIYMENAKIKKNLQFRTINWL